MRRKLTRWNVFLSDVARILSSNCRSNPKRRFLYEEGAKLSEPQRDRIPLNVFFRIDLVARRIASGGY
jgi:hypothetical protein